MHLLDWRDVLPRHATRNAPLRFGDPEYITLHYNGPAINQVRTLDEWREHLKFIAQYHIDSAALLGDGIQYHYAVLPTGDVIHMRDDDTRLSHCGNVVGNRDSLAIHFPLGGSQVPTGAAWDSAIALFHYLSTRYQIPPTNVYGHRQWPRKTGNPGGKQQAGQGPCPGDAIMAFLAEWQTQRTTSEYRVKHRANVREAPNVSAPIAWDGTCILPTGMVLEECSEVTGVPFAGDARWVHWPEAGFIHMSALEHMTY